MNRLSNYHVDPLKANWIVFSSYDSNKLSAHMTLREAEIYGGSCAGLGKHRVIGGYEETDDHGRLTVYNRRKYFKKEVIENWIKEDIQERLNEFKERLEQLQNPEGSEYHSYLVRKDGKLLDDNSNLYFECPNGKTHRVYGDKNEVVYN
jgi:hypothetical protein